MLNPTAAILIIGDEILSGRTRDSNMHYLSCELTKIGIDLQEARFIPDSATKIIEDVRREKGVNPREISDDEILSRLHGALINEGTRILEEGHAFRASDIDVCYVNGYGFAAHRGGPMWQADKMGVNKIAKEINNHRNADNLSWPESKLMNQLEESNGKLSEFIPDTSNPSKRT